MTENRIPAVYAPRPVIFTWRDLRRRGPVYLLTGNEPPAAGAGQRHALPTGQVIECGTVVYQNDRARIATFRTPGRQPVVGVVRVYAYDVAR